MNPTPVEIDEYKNYLLIFSAYENKKEKNITVKAVGTNQNFDQYIYLPMEKNGASKSIEMMFDSIKEAREAILNVINQE
jgi:hypothetical protein